MLRNLVINKNSVSGLIQIDGVEKVEKSIKFMTGIVKFNGKVIGTLTLECLELNQVALNSPIVSELVSDVTPIVENKYCYAVLLNKLQVKEDKIKSDREDFDARNKKFLATVTEKTETKSTVNSRKSKSKVEPKIEEIVMIKTVDDKTSTNGTHTAIA